MNDYPCTECIKGGVAVCWFDASKQGTHGCARCLARKAGCHLAQLTPREQRDKLFNRFAGAARAAAKTETAARAVNEEMDAYYTEHR
jgi:hypothetical protein